eukprot:symbB.v1.2.032063.t1/scaffold3669.1/size53179/1
MVIVSAAVASLAAGNALCLYRCLFARQYHAWKLETADDLQALVLPSFRCPISQEVMREPVVTSDGQTYERQNIQEWFRRGTQTSPLTNLPLDSKEFLPNLALRQAVADFHTKVCPALREEFENRKRLEQRVEVLLQREAQLQQEISGQEGRRDEAMQALLDSLEEREEDVMKDMECLRKTHEEEMAVELVEAEKQVALAKSKAEADSLRRQRDNALPQDLGHALKQQMTRAGGPQLARQAWALGRIGDEAAQRLLKSLIQRLQTTATTGMHPAAVASTTWAFARLRLHLPRDFVEGAQETLGRMEAQDASLTLWALAKLRCQLSNLEVKGGRWSRWSSRDASTALWACATMQRRPPAMCMEIWCKAFLEKMHSATQQDISNMLWALATLNISTTLSQRCVDEAPLERLHGQAAANAIWALARLQPQRLPELTMREMGQLQSQEWANCVWALATAGIHDEHFFKKAK